MLPFLVILSMYGLQNLEVLIKKYVKNKNLGVLIFLLPVSLLLAWNGRYIVQQFQKFETISYLSGRFSRDEYLARQLPEYRIMQYANKNLPDSARILCMFMGWRGYYLNKTHSFDHHNNPNALIAWLQEPDITVDKIGEFFAKDGTGYLLIRRDLFGQWLQRAEIRPQQLWTVLAQNHLRPLVSHLEYTLYQVSIN
ncbi:MAG: hypothetical protein D3923_12695 [Candidatus Electrothrix sp. AR3]|nr:hypothetical protein [Candidatus Electrothrix sp. AR3]